VEVPRLTTGHREKGRTFSAVARYINPPSKCPQENTALGSSVNEDFHGNRGCKLRYEKSKLELLPIGITEDYARRTVTKCPSLMNPVELPKQPPRI